MRIEPENGIITLMRGDTLTTPIYVNIGTKLKPKYKKLAENEKLYFALMEPNQAFEDAVLKKVYDYLSDTDKDGNVLLKLYPQDTEKLLVGKYYYMIKLRTFDAWDQEVVRTIVQPTLFWLDGNNPERAEPRRHEQGKYLIDHVILEGGELNEDNIDHIIFEGGEVEMPSEEEGIDHIIFEGGEIL